MKFYKLSSPFISIIPASPISLFLLSVFPNGPSRLLFFICFHLFNIFLNVGHWRDDFTYFLSGIKIRGQAPQSSQGLSWLQFDYSPCWVWSVSNLPTLLEDSIENMRSMFLVGLEIQCLSPKHHITLWSSNQLVSRFLLGVLVSNLALANALERKLGWSIWLTFLHHTYLQDHDASSPGSLDSFNHTYLVTILLRFQKVLISSLTSKPSAGFSPSFSAQNRIRQMIWGESTAQNIRFTPKLTSHWDLGFWSPGYLNSI